MKKLLVLLSLMFVSVASATTVNIDWLMDGSTYAQTTCETGGNFSLPSPTPTKYGYHFVGWQQNYVIGSWAQSGTPTPTNPIEPTFWQFGNTVLRAIGSGDNFIADSYDSSTGKITRRIGVKVLDGTEEWTLGGNDTGVYMRLGAAGSFVDGEGLCTHSIINPNSPYIVDMNQNEFSLYSNGNMSFKNANTTSRIDWKQFLADQYANETPVTVYYLLAEPVEEDYND